MEKKNAFILALLITLIFFGNWLFFNVSNLFPDREEVVISRVIDGDTIELEDGRIIRLLNINTPEKGKPFSKEASGFLEEYLGKTIELETDGKGKYGRVLGRIYDSKYINLEIVKQGHAHVYIFGDNELESFKKAEEEARKKERGIWQKSEHAGCLDVEINKNDEFLSITDTCGLDFKGFTIKDESHKDYEIDSSQTNSLILYSEKGVDKDEKLYWGRGEVWNDDRDSVFVRDKDGFLVYYDSYGY